MNYAIYNPLEEYKKKFKDLHLNNTNIFFEELVSRSGVDIDTNRATVKKYNELTENLKKLRKKRNLLRFFRVLMIISIILIPLVFMKMTPKIRALKEEIDTADKKADELYDEAMAQMAPLHALFTDKDALRLIEKTLPLITFDNCFSVDQENDMKTNYDFCDFSDEEQSTIDVLAGKYNENPFVFENKLVHRMGTATYDGYKTIFWTETYRDSDGRLRTRTRSQTLHATVTKPKPYYSTQVTLTYCNQGGPDLSFSRDATHLEQKSERELERYVKRGEKRLKRKTDKAIKNNDDFVSMSNSDFEVLFDALDRTNEVQFRTLFTPLAQTNMVDLITSKDGYGDDFNFYKQKRTNKIVSNHSQNRDIIVSPERYISHSFDMIKEKFTSQNTEFFKAVYFDFAPLWAIPMYQERPVHSLKPIPDYSQEYSLKECEALANMLDVKEVVHPRTKTQAILKSTFISSNDKVDTTQITAYSYDIEGRIDLIPVLGGDGRLHSVPVSWDDYLPLVNHTQFNVATTEIGQSKNIITSRNGLCIFR